MFRNHQVTAAAASEIIESKPVRVQSLSSSGVPLMENAILIYETSFSSSKEPKPG